MYYPCIECNLRYGKQYSENECNCTCDYAIVVNQLKEINRKLKEYYNQQEDNEYVDNINKKLILRVIENCQKIAFYEKGTV